MLLYLSDRVQREASSVFINLHCCSCQLKCVLQDLNKREGPQALLPRELEHAQHVGASRGLNMAFLIQSYISCALGYQAPKRCASSAIHSYTSSI